MAANKLCMVAASEDGNRIYCTYKENNIILLKGFYDFNKETFVVMEFYTKKLTTGQKPEDVIASLKKLLFLDYDWELRDEERIIEHIKEGLLKAKRKKRKRKQRNNG